MAVAGAAGAAVDVEMTSLATILYEVNELTVSEGEIGLTASRSRRGVSDLSTPTSMVGRASRTSHPTPISTHSVPVFSTSSLFFTLVCVGVTLPVSGLWCTAVGSWQ
jgi:hypothetical protein